MALTGAFGEFLIRRKIFHRGVFNVAQWTLAVFVAGLVFEMLGGVALQSQMFTGQETRLPGQLVPFMGFGLVFLALNHAAVSLAIALNQSLRFMEVWAQMLGHSGASLHDVLISPLAIAVAFLYVQLGVAGILVVILPLLFIRHSYWTTSRLREANKDLLKVLVKAIETRDPYTSGHSLRVSHLARRIAEELGLPRGETERIERAALLHDIGKIEAVFTGILAKPESLTPEERAVIQSHAAKGEEVLRNLSSFPEDIILSVRHHHEREDGRGYPDGLEGPAIPLGAKIISVCDAVDAMLSDRPYRRALSIAAVLEQLRLHAGTQFDERVVRALVDGGLINEYADFMRANRVPLTVADEPSAPLGGPVDAWTEPVVRRRSAAATVERV
jgi:putative nucleotidyltransferase with HDIG domain